MGLSRRAYAAHRGALGLTGSTDAAVRKAIQTGRITLEPDGTIDPVKADRQWSERTAERNTAPGPAGEDAAGSPAAAAGEPVPDLAAGGTVSFQKARSVNEVLRARRQQLALDQARGELVDRKKAEGMVFAMARRERDAWQTWPARIAAEMAASLGVDAHILEQELTQRVHEHLQELAEVRVVLR